MTKWNWVRQAAVWTGLPLMAFSIAGRATAACPGENTVPISAACTPACTDSCWADAECLNYSGTDTCCIPSHLNTGGDGTGCANGDYDCCLQACVAGHCCDYENGNGCPGGCVKATGTCTVGGANCCSNTIFYNNAAVNGTCEGTLGSRTCCVPPGVAPAPTHQSDCCTGITGEVYQGDGTNGYCCLQVTTTHDPACGENGQCCSGFCTVDHEGSSGLNGNCCIGPHQSAPGGGGCTDSSACCLGGCNSVTNDCCINVGDQSLNTHTTLECEQTSDCCPGSGTPANQCDAGFCCTPINSSTPCTGQGQCCTGQCDAGICRCVPPSTANCQSSTDCCAVNGVVPPCTEVTGDGKLCCYGKDSLCNGVGEFCCPGLSCTHISGAIYECE